MGNSQAGEEEDFDPYLGLVLGETWWQLGRNFGRVLTGSATAQQKHLSEWCTALRKELDDQDMRESLAAITPKAVAAFVATATRLLERKFAGRNIARHILELTAKSAAGRVYDDGQYVDIQEPPETFWAVEYDFLFADLARPSKGKGWLNAVAHCADPECNTFFIKARIDQRFHTASCRTRFANREAYNARTGPRPHSRRGRPRARR